MSFTLEQITVDCADPQTLAAWWAEATCGRIADDWGDYVRVATGIDGLAVLGFQRVPEDRVGKNRVHIDLESPGREADVRRLLDLGATQLGEGSAGPMRWSVLADPEGNEFCVCTGA